MTGGCRRLIPLVNITATSEEREAGVASAMSDPRNVAHDKRVKQEKSHQHASGAGAGSKRRRGPKAETTAANEANVPAPAAVEQTPGELEKSQSVLSKLKEMEFHSRANIEALAQLTLTVEEELKQKEFSGSLGEIYAAQDAFHSKIAELIQSYETKLGTMRPSA
jgi:hypothetical protein